MEASLRSLCQALVLESGDMGIYTRPTPAKHGALGNMLVSRPASAHLKERSSPCYALLSMSKHQPTDASAGVRSTKLHPDCGHQARM